MFRQIDNSGSREVKATLLDSLFSGGGQISDWTMVNSHNSTGTLDVFEYDGSLVDPLTNGDPMDYFSDGSSYLRWFKHDILNVIFSEDFQGKEFLPGYEVVGGVMMTQDRAATGQCGTTSFFNLERCLVAETITYTHEPFGVDYTYVSDSPIYNSKGSVDDENLAAGEVDELGRPRAFWKDQRNPGENGRGTKRHDLVKHSAIT